MGMLEDSCVSIANLTCVKFKVNITIRFKIPLVKPRVVEDAIIAGPVEVMFHFVSVRRNFCRIFQNSKQD